MSHSGEESGPYKVPIVVMNRKSRHNRRNKALSKTTEKSTPGRGLAGIEGWETRVPPGEGAAAPWAFPHRKVRGPAPPGRTGPRRRWDCRVVPGERGRGAPLRHDMRGDAPAGGQAICFRVPLG